MSIHIFGIRHHGPGSARSLRQALETLQPDAILVEGPPDADGILPLLIHPEMQPPVALLIYVPDEPNRAVYYPFAAFSPEWQALHYGLSRSVPVRFMDLPQMHQLAKDAASSETQQISEAISQELLKEAIALRSDPLRLLAEAAGYSDGERWWEHLVEQRRDSADLFDAILEAMAALRSEVEKHSAILPEETAEMQREAYMRQTIRAAQKAGFQKIAVVCGAWHAPALATMSAEKQDAEILKKLPKIKVESTWVPWSYGRLAASSGYGAGVESPGWYDHLWNAKDRVAIRWMTKVARLLREKDLDASSAHVIEAVRLAEALAAIRSRPLPGLEELNEATRSVLCFGDDTPMRLIGEELIVGDRIGEVPDETPMVPLQQDFRREKKRLKLPENKDSLALDLRKQIDLERSHLLHRLALLNIPWGEKQQIGGMGTFKENWRLQWQPEYAVKLIEAGIWGNTLDSAATAFAVNAADKAADLPALTALCDRVLLAELPDAVSHLMARLQTEAAIASDVGHLMDALPPLANVLRYGNVRKTDASTVAHVTDGLVARICIGLPSACASLNDEAAEATCDRIVKVNAAVKLLQNEEYLAAWQGVLMQLCDRDSLHGLLAGRCCRLLLDAGAIATGEAARRMGLALSTANEPTHSAAWVEGFLKGSGLLLLHDDALWQAIDSWVTQLSDDTFTALLPLLRRTFATFSAPERRQMGERVKRGAVVPIAARVADAGEFDTARADSVLAIVSQLLGVTVN